MGYTSGTKWTYELVKETLLAKGYILIDLKYKNALSKLTFKDMDSYYYFQSISVFLRSNPMKFDVSNPYTIQNMKNWCVLNNKPFELISTNYSNAKTKMQWRCLKEDCGEIFLADWSGIYSGNGCGVCVGAQVTLSNCLATKRPDLTLEWHPTKNGDLTPYDITYGCNKYAWWKCLECGYEWKAKIFSRSCNNRGCSQCAESKGEKQLDILLTKYDIPHHTQYTFDDLKGVGGGLLKFDVPVFWDKEKTQLIMLIEYDGKQHYEWVKGMMTKKEFETLQIHDELKNEYCKKHNIILLRIPYWEFDNIEEILKNELKI